MKQDNDPAKTRYPEDFPDVDAWLDEAFACIPDMPKVGDPKFTEEVAIYIIEGILDMLRTAHGEIKRLKALKVN